MQENWEPLFIDEVTRYPSSKYDPHLLIFKTVGIGLYYYL
jgi:hypothetical protein